MMEDQKRARQAAAVRKLASVFAKADGGSSAAQQADERRTLELIRGVTSEPEVTALIAQRLGQLEAVAAATTAGADDVGQTYARMLAADREKASIPPTGAVAALRWLVEQYLPGGGAERSRSPPSSSPLNGELLGPAYWLGLAGSTDVHVCGGAATGAATTAGVSSAAAPSSGVPFAVAAAASVAIHRLLPTPHLPWLGTLLALSAAVLAPELLAADGRARVGSAEAERVTSALRGPGYAIAHGPGWSRSGRTGLETVQTLMRQLKSAGWPAAFCFVFDEAWELLNGMWGVAEQVLGPGCVLEPSVFAWALGTHYLLHAALPDCLPACLPAYCRLHRHPCCVRTRTLHVFTMHIHQGSGIDR